MKLTELKQKAKEVESIIKTGSTDMNGRIILDLHPSVYSDMIEITQTVLELIEMAEMHNHNLFHNFIRTYHLSRKWDKFLEDWERFKKQENITP